MSKPPAFIEAEAEIGIPFQDCDPMGVTWHGTYFRYLETARAALLDKIDFGYLRMSTTGYAWPIVDTRLKFLRPTRFSDRVVVQAVLVEYDNRLKLEYLVRNAATGEAVARGYTIQVAVRLDNGEMCFSSPPVLIERVRACAGLR